GGRDRRRVRRSGGGHRSELPVRRPAPRAGGGTGFGAHRRRTRHRARLGADRARRRRERRLLMRQRPTLHDVAARAGVSTSTVSRVLNSHPHVGWRTREAVTKAMVDLGYQRNEVARSLRMNATMAVGLIV